MKHWNSDFFLIDRMAIPNNMTWRHPKSVINNPKPVVGSYRMADARHLSAHVVRLKDIPKGVLVLSRLSRDWKSKTCDLVLWGADGIEASILLYLLVAVDVALSNPTLEDLAASNPSAKGVLLLIRMKGESSNEIEGGCQLGFGAQSHGVLGGVCGTVLVRRGCTGESVGNEGRIGKKGGKNCYWSVRLGVKFEVCTSLVLGVLRS
uniref:Uncharacterized protein n=1 Tax=Tanacetum cinerariifolium TaxID=118510 RepID=A0A699GMU4_TANCI|nr:hypothetical protein [Tanacetum cinerariifolium]